jgi:hypothetical protein
MQYVYVRFHFTGSRHLFLYVSKVNLFRVFFVIDRVIGFLATALRSRAINRVTVELKTKVPEIALVSIT